MFSRRFTEHNFVCVCVFFRSLLFLYSVTIHTGLHEMLLLLFFSSHLTVRSRSFCTHSHAQFRVGQNESLQSSQEKREAQNKPRIFLLLFFIHIKLFHELRYTVERLKTTISLLLLLLCLYVVVVFVYVL